MKPKLILMLVFLLFCGCDDDSPSTTSPKPVSPPTASPKPVSTPVEKTSPVFQDKAASANVCNTSSGNGAIWLDYDHDGDLDLHLVNMRANGATYQNKGDGTFETVSIGLSLAGDSIKTMDYDGDGYLDVAIGTNNANVKLYRNTEKGLFTDVTAASGISVSYSNVMAWGNYYNGDNKQDVFFGNDGKLFKNNGNGTFSDTTACAFLVAPGPSVMAAWIDYDNDGYDDLIVSPLASTGKMVLYHNRGNGTFEDVSAAAKINYNGKNGHFLIGDYDNDGYADIYAFRGRSDNLLLHNNGNGTFSDVADESGVRTTDGHGISGGAFVDYDNDGDLDLYVNGGRYGKNNLFRNKGGIFIDVAAIAGLCNTDDTHAIAIGDFNGDNYPDIYEVNFTGYRSSANKLLINVRMQKD